MGMPTCTAGPPITTPELAQAADARGTASARRSRSLIGTGAGREGRARTNVRGSVAGHKSDGRKGMRRLTLALWLPLLALAAADAAAQGMTRVRRLQGSDGRGK